MKKSLLFLLFACAALFCVPADGGEFLGAKHRRSKRVAIASMLFGDVFFVDDRKSADFCVFEVDKDSMADLNVYKVNSSVEAWKTGLWYVAKNPSRSYKVYVARSEDESDITVRFVERFGSAGLGRRP